MSSICIIDTTVFCNLLRVPFMDQDAEDTFAELRRFIDLNYTLPLPVAVVYETGNHVAQNGNGRQRRSTAERFVDQVRKALNGASPFRPTYIHSIDEIDEWLSTFPDQAMRGIGLGDCSIIELYHHQCRLNKLRRVFIWSYDDHLAGYDTQLGKA